MPMLRGYPHTGAPSHQSQRWAIKEDFAEDSHPYSGFTAPFSTASLNRIVKNRPSTTGAHVYELVLYV